jgi:GWT1
MKANLPYILWVAAVNTTLILAFLLLDMYNFPSPAIKSMQTEPESFKLTVPRKIPEISIASPSTQVPLLLEAVNKNGLVLFLAVRSYSRYHSSLSDAIIGQCCNGFGQSFTADDVHVTIGSVIRLDLLYVQYLWRGVGVSESENMAIVLGSRSELHHAESIFWQFQFHIWS